MPDLSFHTGQAGEAGQARRWPRRARPLASGIAQIMPKREILIVGGGMAGSLLALTLGRQGCPVVVFDPKADPSPVFRNEKLGREQISLLDQLGVLGCFEEVCWPTADSPGAYSTGKRPELFDCGARHHTWLRAVRKAWPANVRFVETTVHEIEESAGEASVTTIEGQRFTGHLVVLATGRLETLAASLGIDRKVTSPGHSVCLGFSLTPTSMVPAQIHSAPQGSGLGYVSIFPMPGELRVNVFSYRSMTDPWTRRMSADPLAALNELCPAAAMALKNGKVVRRCEARGTDLYSISGHRRLKRVILIGDAYHAPCPASGTGMLRILNDVLLLSDRFIPAWLLPCNNRLDVKAFYLDREKLRVDRASVRRSRLGRMNAVARGPYWTARRSLRGMLSSFRRSLAPAVTPHVVAHGLGLEKTVTTGLERGLE